MPCQGGMSYDVIIRESGTVIDDLAQKLCYLCASLYADGLLEKYASDEIISWHKDHMHKDEVRIGTEMQNLFRNHPDRMDDTDGVANEFLQAALKVHPVSKYHRRWFKKMAREVADAIRKAKKDREREHQVRKQALDKLSDDEKKALGLV